MDENAQPTVEWIAELAAGPFRSRSHVVNHLDMVFGCGSRHEAGCGSLGARCALVRVDDYPQWRVFTGFHSASERKRARDHVLAHTGAPDSWEQAEVAWAVDNDGEPNWEAEAPKLTREDAVRVLLDSVEAWADMEGAGLEEFLAKSSCFVLLADWSPVVVDRVGVRTFGPADVPLKQNDKSMMAMEHGNSPAWRAFAIHICKNERVKRELGAVQGGKCPICGEGVERGVVHHVDYDHECALALSGQPWAEPGSRVRPDCARCMDEFPGYAADCVFRLRLVHQRCNRAIEQY